MKDSPLILILIGGHFALAPRPQKEAAAAKGAGYEVHLRGVWWDEGLAKEDLELARRIGVSIQPLVDLQPSSRKGRIIRLRQRFAMELYKNFGFATSRCFGVGGPEMLREAVRLKPSLTMVHSEAGLWVAKQLIERGFRVGVDFEDWFSEDLPDVSRKVRPVGQLRSLEQFLLRNADPVFTTTEVMANAMAKEAETSRVPKNIPNSFPLVDVSEARHDNLDDRSSGSVSFYWFSQTIGPGRGLESLARALPTLCGKWELHLRGNLRNYDRWFEQHFPQAIRSNVHLHACVSNRDLPHHSASHDVGLALEVPYCMNKDLTASNKIFEYLRCGLAVIASSTQGQMEMMEKCPQAGLLVPPDDDSALAKAMQWFLDNPDRVALAKRKARKAAETTWSWESSEPQLLHAFQLALHRP